MAKRGKKPGKATLDNPDNREKVYEYIRAVKLEKDCWKVVGIEERTYYDYKSTHQDFREAVNRLLLTSKKVTFHEDPELIQAGKESFKKWVLSGCKTTRRQTKYRAVIAEDTEKVEWEPVELTVSEYNNGINLKALELIFPKPIFCEDALNMVIPNLVDYILRLKLDSDFRERLIELLINFEYRYIQELYLDGLRVSKDKDEEYSEFEEKRERFLVQTSLQKFLASLHLENTESLPEVRKALKAYYDKENIAL